MSYGNVSGPVKPIPQNLMLRSGEIVVERLHRLAAMGYRPSLHKQMTIGIRLEHPGKAPRIELWGDGQVVNLYPTQIASDDERIIIGPDEPEEFDRFLRDIPPPTPLQKLLSLSLREAGYFAMVYAIVIGTITLLLRWPQ